MEDGVARLRQAKLAGYTRRSGHLGATGRGFDSRRLHSKATCEDVAGGLFALGNGLLDPLLPPRILQHVALIVFKPKAAKRATAATCGGPLRPPRCSSV